MLTWPLPVVAAVNTPVAGSIAPRSVRSSFQATDAGTTVTAALVPLVPCAR
jgi:hypothetical protein